MNPIEGRIETSMLPAAIGQEYRSPVYCNAAMTRFEASEQIVIVDLFHDRHDENGRILVATVVTPASHALELAHAIFTQLGVAPASPVKLPTAPPPDIRAHLNPTPPAKEGRK